MDLSAQYPYKMILSEGYLQIINTARFTQDLQVWINSQNRSADDFPPLHKTIEFNEWADANLKEPWQVAMAKVGFEEEGHEISMTLVIHFTSEEDMMLFKLRWS
jgi:hypothetical protein